MENSHYHIPAEIRDRSKIRFAHMECCSVEEIKQNIIEHAQKQINIFQDLVELVNNLSTEKIKDFETKYGTYEEIRQGAYIDRDVTIAALISELKRKVRMK